MEGNPISVNEPWDHTTTNEQLKKCFSSVSIIVLQNAIIFQGMKGRGKNVQPIEN
jgi:hypothetical protein